MRRTMMGLAMGLLAAGAAQAQNTFSSLVTSATEAAPPYTGTDIIPLVRGGVTFRVPATVLGGLTAIPNQTVLGNVQGSTAAPAALTQSQLTGLISPATNALLGATRPDTTTITQSGGVLSAVSGGGGINQLTGDIACGPGIGSQACTLPTVNSNVGSFTTANITVNAKGQVTAAASGTVSGASTDTFTYPAITNSVLFTKDGSNVYCSTAPMVAANGSAYNFRAILTGWATASKATAVFLLDAAAVTAKGAVLEFGHDGRWYFTDYNNTAYTQVYSTPSSLNNQATPTTIIDITVGFNSATGHQYLLNSAGSLAARGTSSEGATFSTGLYVCPLAPTFGDIGKVQVQKIS